MKNNIKVIVFSIVSFIIGLTFVTYAGTYNSEEISYDTSTSGAVQTNVKDALDFLYNKTKSGASSECPENMSCVEKPGVTINVTGPGTVDKVTVYVGIGETNTFTVTPTSGYALHNITCDNGYTLSDFAIVTTLVQPSLQAQTITITNPNTANGATCQITFGSNEIEVNSTNINASFNSDKCNSNGDGCICYYIYNYDTGRNSVATRGQSFNYNGHTGCKFKSKTCTYTYAPYSGQTFDCKYLYWFSPDGNWGGEDGGNRYTKCSGVITCAT